MPIAELGAIGLGLVWGWLVGGVQGGGRRPLLDGLVLGAATLLLAAQVVLLTSWLSLSPFLGAVGMAALLHQSWRRRLRTRAGASR